MGIELEAKIFHNHAKAYWQTIPPTLDGVLGGYGRTSIMDIEESEKFLKKIFKLKSAPNKERALDCGAGIGRITKNLLIKHFKIVDMVEENDKFLAMAEKEIDLSCIGKGYCSSLQQFTKLANIPKYDVIWCQWVFGNLTDKDLVEFLKSCKNILTSNGKIVVKENIVSGNIDEFDVTDYNITRTIGKFCQIFEEAGLKVVFIGKQHLFPKELFKVLMFALKFE